MKTSDIDRFHDLCRLRSTLEAFAVELWRNKADKREASRELRSLLKSLKQLAREGDYRSFHRVDQQFHRTMVEAARLDALLKSWDSVAAEVSQWILWIKEAYWPNLIALYREHELLVEAWHSDDASVARQATHQHLESGWHRMRIAQGLPDQDLDPVERAVSFIATHYASRLSVRWIARHVSFLSSSQLNRSFHGRMGMSPSRYLKTMRLERAAQLLRSTSDPVAVVARCVGFGTASHFVRDFRALHGRTPREYRRKSEA